MEIIPLEVEVIAMSALRLGAVLLAQVTVEVVEATQVEAVVHVLPQEVLENHQVVAQERK